jgi:hypothetical protein
MKRIAVFGIAAFLGLANRAHAQLTMNMSNGWSFSLSGNVNAFYVESWDNSQAKVTAINGSAVVQGDGTNANVRTGLLPADLNFDIKGHEGPLDLGVHFGFYPQIQNGGSPGNTHDQFGAQIDMREVYLTAGGGWGQLLAGRAIDPFLRENILTDATLFGTGPTGGNRGAGGTTLGRIGFGYIYPNFNAQLAYSTKAGGPLVWTVAVVQPSQVGVTNGDGSEAGVFSYTPLPRIESELLFTTSFGTPMNGASTNKLNLWVNGAWQEAKAAPTGTQDTLVTDIEGQHTIQTGGAGAGFKLDASRIAIVGSGYWGRGIGTTLMYDGLSASANGSPRTSYGYIGQVTLKLTQRWSVTGSYGESFIEGSNFDQNFDPTYGQLLKYNSAAVGNIQYQQTKSFRWVLEYTYNEAADTAHDKNISNNLSGGVMLFF